MSIKCAIVGANGFLGAALTEKLTENDYYVEAVYNSGYDQIPTTVKKLNIIDFIKTENQFDFIFLSLGNYLCDHQELININSIIQSILQKNKLAKIIFISSTNVYGIHRDIINLHSSFNDLGLYATSKIAGEFLISSHKKFSILRFTYLYGKNLKNNSFLNKIIEKSSNEREIILFGDGSRMQDYLHIDDAVDLCIKAMKNNENGTFIGASGISVSNRIVAQIIAEKHSSIIKYIGKETGNSFHFDISDTIEKLKWRPKIDIVKGINNMIE